nr:PAS domain-containing protein [Nitrospiraceae bacterium]
MEHFELLNLAIESLPLGVTIIDINGKIVYANHAQAEMHGYESHELLGQHTKIFAPPDMWGPLEIKPFQDKSLFIRESLNNNKTGRSFPVRLISIPVKNEKREVLGLVTICEDITKIRELEKQQDRAKELTHRLKNLKLLELAIKGIAHKFN